MNRTDRAALQLAIEHARAESPPDVPSQIDLMLQDRDFWEVAMFAADCAQTKALRLKPWQIAPRWASPDDVTAATTERREAAKLLRKMLATGVSRYHPDPLAAIEEAKRKGVAGAQQS
jgi:hypothetical protein